MGPRMHTGSHIPSPVGRTIKYCLYVMLISITLTTATFPPCPQDCYKTVKIGFRGIRNARAFSSLTSLHKDCYKGKTPTLCQSPDAPSHKFWTVEITQNSRNPCNKQSLQKGKRACYTYLPQLGTSDGEGVQDRALQKVIKDTQARLIQAVKAATLHGNIAGFKPSSP